MIELEMVTPPTGMAIPLAEVKQHLRVDIADDDALITSLLAAAVDHVGKVEAWRTLQVTSWRATFDAWDGVTVWLPLPRVESVTLISIIDESETPPGTVTINVANTTLDKENGRLTFHGAAVGGGGAPGRLRVEYVAGYAALPPWARSAILLLVGHFYENRETVVIGAGVTAIDIPFGVRALAAANQAWRPGGAI